MEEAKLSLLGQVGNGIEHQLTNWNIAHHCYRRLATHNTGVSGDR